MCAGYFTPSITANGTGRTLPPWVSRTSTSTAKTNILVTPDAD